MASPDSSHKHYRHGIRENLHQFSHQLGQVFLGGLTIGIYRFWRDLGYGIGALGFGLVAHLTGAVTAGFWFVAIAMFLSGALVMAWGEETHPRLNPEPD